MWFSPFYRSPMDDFGYDISDHCDVDPLFGALADADAMIAAAHDAGLRVVLDVVPNHVVGPAPLVRGRPILPRRPPPGLVRVARPRSRRRSPQQLDGPPSPT